MKHTLAACWLLLQLGSAWADDALQMARQLIFPFPELTRPGSCVLLREGGEGFLLREPAYWLKGKVISARIQPHLLQSCPEFPGKTPNQLSREEFLRLAQAHPCQPGTPREVAVGIVTLSAEQWDTPHMRRAANQGRLYQGHYLGQKLSPGLSLEIPADLLQPCDNQ